MKILTAIFFFGLILQRFLISDGEFGGFFDEQVTLLSAINFLRYGIYSPSASATVGYEISTSSGLATSWAAGLGWILGGSVFWARVSFFTFHLTLYLSIAIRFLGQTKIARGFWIKIIVAECVFLLTCAVVPYSQGVMVFILGEWVGALILWVAYSVGESRPKLGALLFGVCVWHAKFIYLPFALLGIGFRAARTPRPRRTWVRLMGWFFLPLLAWMGVIVLRTGFHGWWIYLTQQLGLAIHIWKIVSTHEALGQKHIHGLLNRLTSPDLEWSHYYMSQKLQIVALLWIPIFLLVRAARMSLGHGRSKALTAGFQLALVGVILMFSYWWFFLHTEMWIRHLVPCLFVGWGIILGLTFRGLEAVSVKGRRVIFIGILICMGGWELLRSEECYEVLTSPWYNERYSVRCQSPEPISVSNEEFMRLCSK